MDAALIQLSYDDLPPGSDIRHEHSANVVRITIPAGEPSAPAFRRVKHEAFVSAAYATGIAMVGASIALIFMMRANRIGGGERLVAWFAFVVGCGAFVLLVASAYYSAYRSRLITSRQQMTVLAATPARFLIETRGPLGEMSHDLPARTVSGIRLMQGKWHDRHRRDYHMHFLRVYCWDRTMIDIAPGRERRELICIAHAIAAMTGAQVRAA